MAVILGLVRTNWSGTTGGPGLTQLAIESVTDPHTWNASVAGVVTGAVRTMWNSCAAFLPDNIKLDVSPVVDLYSIADGDLVGSVSAGTVPSQVVGTSTAVFMMAAGLKVNLNTSQIKNGRRVRGSVFLVPAASTAFTTDGLALGTTRSTINGAFNTLMGTLATNNLQLTVWSRPIPDGKKYGPRLGDSTAVTNPDTSEKGAILRGRRD
jgi:hypothetical protein